MYGPPGNGYRPHAVSISSMLAQTLSSLLLLKPVLRPPIPHEHFHQEVLTFSKLNSVISSKVADPLQPVGNTGAWKEQRLLGEAAMSQLSWWPEKAVIAVKGHR